MDHSIPTTDRSLPILRHAGCGADRDAVGQLRRVRHPALRCRQRPAGRRPRDRPGAGVDPAGDDRRLRGQPPATHGAFGALAFGIGTSEVEHVLASQCLLQNRPKTYEVRVEGSLKPRGRRQEHHPGAHRQDRHRRRHRLSFRIHRRGDPRPLDGRADDRLQHEHRGRRAGRADRAGRHHIRVFGRPAGIPQGRGLGRRGGGLAAAPRATPARPTIIRSRWTPMRWSR